MFETVAIHPVPGTAYQLRLSRMTSGEEIALWSGDVMISGESVDCIDDPCEQIVRAWLNEQWTKRRASRGVIIEADRMYIIGEGETATVYRTIESKTSGHIYGKRLDGSEWTYAPGAIRDIREHGRRMTIDEAAEISRTLTFCIRCGTHLTNSESIARGIGPICAQYV
jgi:hypothetical protein